MMFFNLLLVGALAIIGWYILTRVVGAAIGVAVFCLMIPEGWSAIAGGVIAYLICATVGSVITGMILGAVACLLFRRFFA